MSAPAARPAAVQPSPPTSIPSSASSKLTALMSAPAPKASTSPTCRSDHGRAKASSAPITSDPAASEPQPSAASTFSAAGVAGTWAGLYLTRANAKRRGRSMALVFGRHEARRHPTPAPWRGISAGRAAASTSAGRRSRRSSSMRGSAVLGQARRATPTTGGPADVMAAIAEAMREATAAAGLEAERPRARRRRIAGRDRRGRRDGRRAPATSPDGRAPTRSVRRSRRSSARRSRWATTSRSPPTPRRGSGRRASTSRCSASSGAPA